MGEQDQLENEAKDLEGEADKTKQEESQLANQAKQAEGEADKTKSAAEDLEKKI